MTIFSKHLGSAWPLSPLATPMNSDETESGLWLCLNNKWRELSENHYCNLKKTCSFIAMTFFHELVL